MNKKILTYSICLKIAVYIFTWLFLGFTKGLFGVSFQDFVYASSRWDSIYYFKIAEEGYGDPFASKWNLARVSFYPLVPILYYLVNGITFTGLQASMMIVTFVFFLLCANELYFFIKNYFEPTEKKAMLLWWGFMIFPFSIFLHMNYTESIYLFFTFKFFNLLKKDKFEEGILFAILSGFTRSTALLASVASWGIWVRMYLEKNNLTLRLLLKSILTKHKEFIYKSLSFGSLAFGTIALFLYYQIRYGNFAIFFQSQREFFNRSFKLSNIEVIAKELKGNYNVYFFPSNPEIVLPWYNNTYQIWIYIYLPFFIVISSTLYLIQQKKWDWAIYANLLWVVPMFSLGTLSQNRYLITSFPYILGFVGLMNRNVFTKYIWYGFSVIFFVISILLFNYEFWVG